MNIYRVKSETIIKKIMAKQRIYENIYEIIKSDVDHNEGLEKIQRFVDIK